MAATTVVMTGEEGQEGEAGTGNLEGAGPQALLPKFSFSRLMTYIYIYKLSVINSHISLLKHLLIFIIFRVNYVSKKYSNLQCKWVTSSWTYSTMLEV